MTNKEALDILKDRKIAYEVVITRTASHENRHMAEEELKLINACIIALEHCGKVEDWQCLKKYIEVKQSEHERSNNP